MTVTLRPVHWLLATLILILTGPQGIAQTRFPPAVTRPVSIIQTLTYDYAVQRGASFSLNHAPPCPYEIRTPENLSDGGVEIALRCEFRPIASRFDVTLFNYNLLNTDWMVERSGIRIDTLTIPPGVGGIRARFLVTPTPGRQIPKAVVRIDLPPFSSASVIVRVDVKKRVVAGIPPSASPLFYCQRTGGVLIPRGAFQCSSSDQCAPGTVCGHPFCGMTCTGPGSGP